MYEIIQYTQWIFILGDLGVVTHLDQIQILNQKSWEVSSGHKYVQI